MLEDFPDTVFSQAGYPIYLAHLIQRVEVRMSLDIEMACIKSPIQPEAGMIWGSKLINISHVLV